MSRRRITTLPVCLLLALCGTVQAEEERFAEHDFLPQTTASVNRSLGAEMDADGIHLVCALKNPAGADGGSVVFMRRVGGTGSWLEISSFNGLPDGGIDIGSTVAIGGERALATTTEFGSLPSVTLYRYSGIDDDWAAFDDLVDRPPGATGEFGSALSVDGDLLLVGDSGAGRVHVYRDLGADVVLEETIVAVSAGAVSFGATVAVSGETIVIGDPDDGEGRVDVFSFDSAVGSSHEGAVSTAGTVLVAGDHFGDALDIDGDVLAVGATRPSSIESGLLFIYERAPDTTIWTLRHTEGTVDGLERFPSAVAVRGGMVVAGAPGTLFGSDSGKMMVFRRSGEVWSFSETLGMPGNPPGLMIGNSVAIASGEVVAGLPGRYTTTFPVRQIGGLISCSVDCDGDGTPDVDEIELGLQVDYDQDGVPDYCEIDEYVLVPLDFATIQAALDEPFGRTILLQPGVYTEEVAIDGDNADIRAFVPTDRPVWSTGIVSGNVLYLTSSTVRLESIVLSNNRQAILASGSQLTLEQCDLLDNGYGISMTESDLVAADCVFSGNDGNGNGGSAISGARADLDLTRCEFSENGGNSNASSASHAGGAIRLTIDGNAIRATECAFVRNVARVDHVQVPDSTSGEALGGAIYASGLTVAATFDFCTFSGNLTESALQQTPGSSPASNYAASAALDLDAEGIPVRIADCVFSDNQLIVLDTAGGSGFIAASTIMVDGFIDDTCSLLQSEVRSPSLMVRYPDGGLEPYPGIEIPAASIDTPTVNIIGCVFENIGGLSIISAGDMEINVSGSSFLDAGHIVLHDGASCSNSDFVGTSLAVDGNVSNCTFERYQSDFRPVVRFFGGNFAVKFLQVASFHQIDAPSVIAGGSEDFPIQVIASTICGNSAAPFGESTFWTNAGGNVIEGGLGGAASCPLPVLRTVPGTHSTIDEALLAANNGDTIRLAGGTFEESVDARGFASLTLEGSAGGTSVIAPGEGLPGIVFRGGTLSVRDLTIDEATVGIDAGFGTVSVENVLISNGVADRGAAILVGSGTDADGDGALVSLIDVEIRDNTALTDGGGIYVASDGALTVESSSFTDNAANGRGGAVFTAEGARSCAVSGTRFDSNIAGTDGGGVFAERMSDLVIQNSDFNGNAAGRFGGGAHLVEGRLQNCDFVGNTAVELGGGARSTGNSQLIGCDFQLNVAGLGGGLASTAVETFVEDFSACGNPGGDWYGNVLDDANVPLYCSEDCNGNGTPDADEISGGLLADCNENLIPDVCEDLADVDQNGVPDECDRGAVQQIRIANLDTVSGLAGGATGVLLRPLFRNGTRTHDALVLDANGAGSIARVVPDMGGGYVLEETLPGAGFERCCATLVDPVGLCINNGPSGAADIVFARGDLVLPHPSGNTGLFDEDFEMYYGCDAPAGIGLPSPITDYELAPDTNQVTSLRYSVTSGAEGLAGSEPSKKSQVLVSTSTSSSSEKKPSSSRKGSGQGGTGPYPGVDQTDEFGFSISALDSGNFNGDGDDDLVLLHPEENAFSVRNFTGLVDIVDPDTGAPVPSGATWSSAEIIGTTDSGLDLVCGQFVDLPGTADDGLDDVAIVLDVGGNPVLKIWASSGDGSMTQVGSGYPLLTSNFKLGSIRVTADGTELILVAQSDSSGVCYLDYVGWNPESQEIQTDWLTAGSGQVVGLSTTAVNYGISDREIAAVLTDGGASSALSFFALSLTRPYAVPENDSCSSPVVIVEGDTEISTLGATTNGNELPVDCESDGSTQIYQDTWYQWTATCSGSVTVSTCGAADFDTWLAAYDGGCDEALVGCNDENPECADNTSRMTFLAVEGNSYLIRVGSWMMEGWGEAVLTLSCPGLPGDFNGDGLVDGADLSVLLGGWGQPGPTDINGDGTTDGADLATLLGVWS